MCDDSISMAYEAAEAFFSSREERMNYINSEMAGVDYRSGMQDAEDRGIKIGEERGIKIGEKSSYNPQYTHSEPVKTMA